MSDYATNCMVCGSTVQGTTTSFVICSPCCEAILAARKILIHRPPSTSYDSYEHKYTCRMPDGSVWHSWDGEHWEKSSDS